MKEGIEMVSTMRIRITFAVMGLLALLVVTFGGFIRSTDASLRNPVGADPVGWAVTQVERATIPT